jgi:glycine/D-amino acid oxidase-like deaminating enzyme
MDLHTGRPVWSVIDDRVKPPFFPATEGDLRCEVLIVGGGVSGALIGYLLMQRGADCIIVDRRTPGLGSTLASTGLLQYEVDTPLSELVDLVGREHAVHAYRRGLTAIDDIERLVGELNDPCEFTRRKSLYFAGRFWHHGALKREYDLRKELGFDVAWLTRGALAERTSITAAGAMVSGGDAEIDPFRFTQALLRAAARGGLRIFGQTDVVAVDERPDEIRATTEATSAGAAHVAGTITAKRIVWATGYETCESLPKIPGRLRSTYAAASEPIDDPPGWPERWLIWETARPYFYARRTRDGRIIIGGEDTSLREDHVSEDRVAKKTEKLRRRFTQLFPQVPFETACTWAGTFAETKDGLAYIGRLPAYPNSYAALGYGGNGITFSAIAAKLIADLITGRPNDDEAVFRFER